MTLLLITLLYNTAPPPMSPLVRLTIKALYLQRLIRYNTPRALSAMDRAYNSKDLKQRGLNRERKNFLLNKRQLLYNLALLKAVNRTNSGLYTKDYIRLKRVMQRRIIKQLQRVEAAKRLGDKAAAGAFLSTIRAINATATALWLKQKRLELYSTLEAMNTEPKGIPGLLGRLAGEKDASAAILLRRLKAKAAFTWQKGVRNPVSGARVIRQFGPLQDPKYPIMIAGPGIGLYWSGKGQRNVRCVSEGVVEYVGVLPALGPTVIVDHGMGMRSVYGGMDIIDVKTGEVLSEGMVLGRLDSKKGPCILFFALEKDDQWQNPAKYIRETAR